MKTILGLDLGSSSIGWALIGTDDCKSQIIDLGSRIIPLSTDEATEFAAGQKISKNQNRTLARTARKGYDRYQLRRTHLLELLRTKDMQPSQQEKDLSKLSLWDLRASAVDSRISLKELGRVLLHINQKRGYKSGRKEGNTKEETNYVKDIENRRGELNGRTVGQYLYEKLQENEFFRVKDNIFFREDYLNEFNLIIEKQREYYPDILTDEFIKEIGERTIFYQRPLKSQKGLVSICEFEGTWRKNKEGKDVFTGPRVAPKSSPVAELCRIWENINNLKLKDKFGNQYQFSVEDKQRISEYMQNNPTLTLTSLLKILELKKEDGFESNKQLEKGIQASKTYTRLQKCLVDKNSEYLTFYIKIEPKEFVDPDTGEIVGSSLEISPEIEKQPLYRLWHTIYSIQDPEECKAALIKHFPSLSPEEVEKLSQIDFKTDNFSNKSVRCMRKIIPYLMQGYTYDKAMEYAGHNHSNSITKEQNLERQLIQKLALLPKNSLRQPVVEKILNQMINLVNAIIDKHGSIDQIRIELARELKQSAGERDSASKAMSKREKEHKIYAKEIQGLGYRPTKNNILKYRLFKETPDKVQPICLYCGQPIGISSALSGDGVEVEHILPKALIYDDSQSNKILAHRHCNLEKRDQTAYDYIKGSKSPEEFDAYVERVEDLYKSKIISKTKRTKLLMSGDKLPENFIDRQLRQSQYIARKAVEILSQINRNVSVTGGGITAMLRDLWGWNEVLENLNLPKYREFEGLISTEEYQHSGQTHTREKIVDWTKRDDHRHHAIDALVIACTEQGFIQRINTLSQQDTREKMYQEVQNLPPDSKHRRTLLERYLESKKPFSTAEVEAATSKVLISIKSGQKVTTLGTRKVKKNGKKTVVQSEVIIPRGQLNQETVYGKIRQTEMKNIKYLFENTDAIVDTKIKNLVLERISLHGGDVKKAISSLKRDPLYLDEAQEKCIAQALCFYDEYVVKYPINPSFNKVEKVIDGGVKKILQSRLAKFGDNPKEAFKNVTTQIFDSEDNATTKTITWWEDEGLERPIKSVRCSTGLSAVTPINDSKGFVKPGNNHNLVIYKDSSGEMIPRICTFWEAVQRKMYGIPVIVTKPNELWDDMEGIESDFEAKYSDKATFAQHKAAFESILENLPMHDWTLDMSFIRNQMYILGLDTEIALHALENKDYATLGRYIYRVQKFAAQGTSFDMYFRLQYETKLVDTNAANISKRVYRITSTGTLEKLNPIKVHINYLGEITKIGE